MVWWKTAILLDLGTLPAEEQRQIGLQHHHYLEGHVDDGRHMQCRSIMAPHHHPEKGADSHVSRHPVYRLHTGPRTIVNWVTVGKTDNSTMDGGPAWGFMNRVARHV